MATITTDTYLDGGTARTAGETWTCNGGKLTVRTDTRWHANAPASMAGSLSSITVSATLGGGVLFDGRNVRWMPYDTGTSTVPAIGTTITQGGVSGYLLGVWDTLTSAPTAVGAAMPANGHIKFREITGGPFTTGALTGIGANATGPDVAGWIEVVMDQSAVTTVSRKGTGSVSRGDWFYLDNTTGAVAQVLQVPTNGGGANTYCPGVWIETGVGTDEYEFWPGLNGSTNGWAVQHIGAPAGGTDKRQSFVKSIGSGQMQIGEVSTSASLAYAITSSSGTYTLASNIVTVSFTAHGLSVGESVYLDFTTGTATDGVYTVEQVTGANAFTVALAAAATSGNVTLRARTVITYANHPFAVGNVLNINASSGSLADGTYEVTAVVTGASGTITIAAAPAANTAGNCTIEQTIGHVPVSGCKTRVPNVFLRQCTTGARATNAAPHATVATRPDFITTGAGVIDHEYTYGDWYYLTLQAYQTRLVHCATFDAVSIAECATGIDMQDGGVGMHGALDNVVLTLTSNFAGGTISGWKFPRGNAPGTTDHSVSISLCAGQTFENCESGIVQFARSTGLGWNISQSDNLTFNSCRQINSSAMAFTTCSGIRINDLDHVDRFTGYTNATSATYTVTAASKCNDIIIDGVTEGYSGAISRQHSYAGILSVTASSNIKLRNVGTRAAPLSYANKVNDRAAIYVSGANNANIYLQRCYVGSVRTALLTDANSDKGVLYELVSAPHLSTFMPYTLTVAALNATVKGVTAPLNTVAANASVYGTHLYDQRSSWFRMLSTYTWAANVVTVTSPTHGLSVGDKVYLDFTSGGGTPDGVYTVKTITSATVFTVALTGSGTAGNVIAWRNLTATPADLLTTEGVLALPMNEATTETSPYVTVTGTAQFTSAPGLTFPATDDEVVFESQHAILGYTAFPNIPVTMTGIPTAVQASTYTWAANVVTVTFTAHGLLAGDQVYLDFTSGGGTPDGLYTIASVTSANVYTINLTGSGTAGNVSIYRNLLLRYKINTGSGYSAYKNLSLRKAGGATTSGSATITMGSTTGVAVNDYIYGIGVGVNAKVQSIDSATQITATVNSVATGNTLLLEFNYLPNETISASTGFGFQVSAKADTPGSTMVITYLTIPISTTGASQDNLYPLDTNTITLTGLKNPTEVRIFDAGTTTAVAGQENVTTGTFTAQIDAGSYPDVDISILSLGYQNTRLLGIDMTADVSIPIQQNLDRQYENA